MSTDSRDMRPLLRVAAVATLGMLIIIPLQIGVFILYPPPNSVLSWFSLFQNNPIVAFFEADFFILVNNILITVIYLALYQTLKEHKKYLLQIGLVLGFIGIASYLSSCKPFELLSLSQSFFHATNAAEQNQLLAAGQVMIVSWQGTAFDAYYVLNAITLLIISLAMLKSSVYGKVTAIIGLVSAAFMAIPSTAGTIGLVFSLLSLIPWYVFAVRFGLVFRKMAWSE